MEDGGLFAFSVLPPESDTVRKLVGVVVKPLLALLGAPPFLVPPHCKGRFVRNLSDAAKHEHRQNIKLAIPVAFFDDLQLVPV